MQKDGREEVFIHINILLCSRHSMRKAKDGFWAASLETTQDFFPVSACIFDPYTEIDTELLYTKTTVTNLKCTFIVYLTSAGCAKGCPA